MSRLLTAALLAAALAAPVAASAAETTTPSPAQENAAPAADPNKKICKKTDVTGYRLRKSRICLTAAEWAARQQDERQALNKTQVQRGLKGE